MPMGCLGGLGTRGAYFPQVPFSGMLVRVQYDRRGRSLLATESRTKLSTSAAHLPTDTASAPQAKSG